MLIRDHTEKKKWGWYHNLMSRCPQSAGLRVTECNLRASGELLTQHSEVP